LAIILDPNISQEGQEDVSFPLSGFNELRLTKVVIQEYKIANGVLTYVLNEVEL